MQVIVLVLHEFAKIRILSRLFTVSMSFVDSIHYGCHIPVQFNKPLKKQYNSHICVCHCLQIPYEQAVIVHLFIYICVKCGFNRGVTKYYINIWQLIKINSQVRSRKNFTCRRYVWFMIVQIRI